MNTRMMEIWVGVFVAGGLAALFMLAMKVSNLSSYSDTGGYEIVARFEDSSGLKVRSPVTMAGVRIGRVSSIEFDPVTFQARVTMKVESRYNALPSDTSASIYTAGLLGEKYVGLEPGGSEENMKQGSLIKITQGSLVLEKLIGQFVSRFLDNSDAKKASK